MTFHPNHRTPSPPRAGGDEAPAGPARHDGSAPREIPEVQRGASGVPDLVALPAFEIVTFNDEQTGEDLLAFASNVWNAGRGPLVVEGFRSPGANLMTAYQYFYDAGRRMGRERVGTLEFDERDGHNHWHFTDFAQYRLLDAEFRRVVRSGKEAFCLAPTDAIDLTIRGANWSPGSTGFFTACGSRTSIWIREILDAGWGDTYFQFAPGQSFSITDVPNGSYFVQVTANPKGRLREITQENNFALRRIELGGTRGDRTVEVVD